MVIDLAIVTGVITIAAFFISLLPPLIKLNSRMDVLDYRQQELTHAFKELKEEIRQLREK